MKKINLILPAAGLGSRFREVGQSIPKPLIPVFDIPMIMWVLLNFPLDANDKVWIISQAEHHLPEAIGKYRRNLPFQIEFLEIEGLTEGPASTVDLVLKDLNDDEGLIVANTDQYVFGDLSPFLQMVRNGDCSGQILTMTASSKAWSYVGRDSDGKINLVVEKEEISSEATVGIYGWSKAATAKDAFRHTFENDIRTNNEFYVAPTYNHLISNGLQVETYLIGDHGNAVHGLGIPSDLNSFIEIPEVTVIAGSMQGKLDVK
jgi:NDP-sugar pyrophosphorylase family protein